MVRVLRMVPPSCWMRVERCVVLRSSGLVGFQKRPEQFSCLFASRAIGSLRARMNHEISDKRLRTSAIRFALPASVRTSFSVGSASCSSSLRPGKTRSHLSAASSEGVQVNGWHHPKESSMPPARGGSKLEWEANTPR
jgi:hypothetical protein